MTSRYALRLPVVPSQYSNVVLNCVRMEIVMREVYVIGHKNPDTDSVCSAICYSRLKNLITGSEDYIPKRAVLGIGQPQGSYKEAADINRDGVIDLYDFVAIKRHILNIGYIQQ